MLLAGGGSLFPELDERPKWYHFRLAFPLGAIWWGLPFGALVVLVALTVSPDASLPLLLWVFGGMLLATGVAASAATLMSVLMGLVPRRD
jgi:hypothetical protein